MTSQPYADSGWSTQVLYSTVPIDYANREIRLMKLQRNEECAKLRCTFESYPVEGPLPLYIALSYAWSRDIDFAEIELNGHTFSVGRNLWLFLYQMSLSEKFFTYWIDAICIDQSNLQERNHQVQLMRYIYSNAESVYAWLGEEDEAAESNKAMIYLEKRETLEATRVNTKRFWSPREARAVLSLCERSYWTRMWIVQELLLPKRVMILCGSRTLAWYHLERLFEDIAAVVQSGWGHHTRVSPILASAASDIVKAKSSWKDQSLSLMALLRLCRNQQSTDLRDKVYALQGLANDSHGLKVDYGITSEQLLVVVYEHTCKTFKTSRNLRNSKVQLAQTARLLQDVLKAHYDDDELGTITVAVDRFLRAREKGQATLMAAAQLRQAAAEQRMKITMREELEREFDVFPLFSEFLPLEIWTGESMSRGPSCFQVSPPCEVEYILCRTQLGTEGALPVAGLIGVGVWNHYVAKVQGEYRCYRDAEPRLLETWNFNNETRAYKTNQRSHMYNFLHKKGVLDERDVKELEQPDRFWEALEQCVSNGAKGGKKRRLVEKVCAGFSADFVVVRGEWRWAVNN